MMRARALAVAWLLLACDEPAPPPTPPEVIAPEPAPEPPAPPPPATRAGPTCTYHGFCWVRPAPVGNDLYGVWVGVDRVVAVGERGTILSREGARAGEPITLGWALEDAPSRELLRDVWGASAEDLWAVGEGGQILRRGAEGWATVESGVSTALVALWGRAADDVFAVGEAGVILHWNGAAWARETVSTEWRFTDVHGNLTSIYALAVDPGATDRAARSQLFERTDAGWQPRDELEGDFPALHVAEDGAVTVIGGEARRRAVNARFVTQRLTIDRPINAVYGNAEGQLHAVGYTGRAAQLSGAAWSRATLADEVRDLYAIAGAGAGDAAVAWAVGADGAIARYAAGAWVSAAVDAPARLRSVWGTGPRDVWVVGDRTSLHFDGETWTRDGPQGDDLRAIGGFGGVALTVGDAGAMHRLAAGAWTAERSGEQELDAIGGVDLAHAIVVGKTTWLTREGEGWRTHEERPSASGVWASGPSEALVASREGLFRWDGASFAQVPETAEWVLFDVWGASRDDVWAVGAEGRVAHFDGRAWEVREVPTAQNLLAVWGSGPRDVWAVGHHGTVLHFDGEGWRWRDSGTDLPLYDVWGSADAVYAVGESGAILRLAL